jgi:alkylation response protein AidB-like acyl-CoA dehydrogenase
VDFQLTANQQRLQHRCRELAADFARRSAAHDRDASHPIENYECLREEGFLALTVGKEWGGAGASFLDHTIAYEMLGQGCPSTALAFNMHASSSCHCWRVPRFRTRPSGKSPSLSLPTCCRR